MSFDRYAQTSTVDRSSARNRARGRARELIAIALVKLVLHYAWRVVVVHFCVC